MSSIKEEQTIREFQSRRENMLKYFGTCLVLLGLGLAILLLSDGVSSFLGLEQRVWRALATVQLFSAILFALKGFRQYRCPVCEKIVRGHDKYYLGVLIDPERCPNCHAKLR